MKYFFVCFSISVFLSLEIYAFSPYANSYPHDQYGTQKFGFNREGAQSGSDGSRFFKNKLYDKDGRLKTNSDIGSVYNLDSNLNSQHTNNLRRGGSQDNLTHIQGQNFEADKSHKRKHIKSGFQNSYHKDENGSRSSFYEDSDDTQGDQRYEKKHGESEDQNAQQYREGLNRGIKRDKYDDRRVDFENRDLVDSLRQKDENLGRRQQFTDNRNLRNDEQFEIVRRPHSDLTRDYGNRFGGGINNDFYRPRQQQQYDWNDNDDFMDYRDRDNFRPQARETTRQRITIYEDPRDDYMNPSSLSNPNGYFQNNNFMRSETSRRLDYGPPNNRSPLRLRYRGMKKR